MYATLVILVWSLSGSASGFKASKEAHLMTKKDYVNYFADTGQVNSSLQLHRFSKDKPSHKG